MNPFPPQRNGPAVQARLIAITRSIGVRNGQCSCSGEFSRIPRLLRTGLAAAAFSLAACTSAPPPDAAAALDVLAQIHQAGADFARAQAAGDVLGMARAARLRSPLDRIPVALGELGQAVPVTTAARMFAAARDVAGDDAALRSEIARLEAEASQGIVADRPLLEGPFGAIGGKSPRRAVGPAIPAPREGPAGAFYRIGARASLALPAPVAADRTLFVYVEVSGGEGVVLRVVDGDGMAICADAQPHGHLLCRWRPGRATTGMVVVDNQGERPASILLIANQ